MSASLLALAAWAAAAPALAARPIAPPAPEFPRGSAWLNSEELSLARMRGRKVVLVTFLNFNSLNSIRALPVLRTWWDRYQLEGLMVIGVHTPDYPFTRDPLYVRYAVRRYNLRFPIVLDEKRALWRAYDNEGWPIHFLVDPRGRIIYDRLGEGDYRQFELEIQEALRRFHGYTPPPDLKPVDDPPTADCGHSTRLLHVGARLGKPISLEGVKEERALVGVTRDGEVAYRGNWLLEPDALRLRHNNAGRTDFVRIIYRGAEAAAVLDSASGRPMQVFLKQNDLWLHGKNAGADVQWDDEDRSYVLVAAPRIYYLTKNSDDAMQELLLFPSEQGGGILGLEFSNACQARAERR